MRFRTKSILLSDSRRFCSAWAAMKALAYSVAMSAARCGEVDLNETLMIVVSRTRPTFRSFLTRFDKEGPFLIV